MITLRTNPLATKDLEDSVETYFGKPCSAGLRPSQTSPRKGAKKGKSATVTDRRYSRIETNRFKKFTYDEIVARDKSNLDIFWLKDESLKDAESSQPPADLATEIVESLEVALEEFRGVEESSAPKQQP